MRRGLSLFIVLGIVLVFSIGLASALCSGTTTPCSNFTSQSSCQVQSGCIWKIESNKDITASAIAGSCSGTPTPCASITTNSSCNLQSGCTWVAELPNNYPSPFVYNGIADVAVIYGTQPGISVLELIEAENIQSHLQSFVANPLGDLLVSDYNLSIITSNKHLIIVGSICGGEDGRFSNSAIEAYKGISRLPNVSCSSLRNLLGIKQGQSLIEVQESPFANDSKKVLWVIGDGVQDLVAASKYLRTNTISTKIGTKIIINSTADECPVGSVCPLLDSNSNPKQIVKFGNYTYEVELLSASDTAATIEVTTTGGQGIAKEVTEGDTKEINGLNVYVKSADETNLKISALLWLSLAETTVIIDKNIDGLTYVGGDFDDVNCQILGSAEWLGRDWIDSCQSSSAVLYTINDYPSSRISVTIEKYGKDFENEILVESIEDLYDWDEFDSFDYFVIKESVSVIYVTKDDKKQSMLFWKSNNQVVGIILDELPLNYSDDLLIESVLDSYLYLYPLNITTTTTCDSGCSLDGECYPYNNRKDGNYCNVDGNWLPQLRPGAQCENHFECGSNVCVSGECIEGNLIQKILAWFRNLFGQPSTKSTN